MKKHFVIVANGHFLVREIITEAIQDKIIIALDAAAANKLMRMDITPTIILGDFDIDKEKAAYWGIHTTLTHLQDDDLPYQGNHGVTLVPKKNQHLTDLTKAIHYCDEEGAESITLLCALGGRMDHHEAALRSLRAEYKPNRQMHLHTEQQTIRFVKNEQVLITGEAGDKCGVFAFPEGSFSSQGLLYDVQDYKLHFGFSESIGNSLQTTRAMVTITGEALLIMPPQLIAQRQFMQKSEKERLQMLLRDV